MAGQTAAAATCVFSPSVGGEAVVRADCAIAQNTTISGAGDLAIVDGFSGFGFRNTVVTVEEGVTLSNSGRIQNFGVVENDGRYVGRGEVANEGVIRNVGGFEVSGRSFLANPGAVDNRSDGRFENAGALTIGPSVTFTNSGVLDNTGAVSMSRGPASRMRAWSRPPARSPLAPAGFSPTRACSTTAARPKSPACSTIAVS